MAVRNYSLKRVFIGRDDEIASLTDIYKKLQMGKGQIVLLEGEHGIGKTKLVEEFKKTIENENFRFLNGRCKRKEGRIPYEPFVEALNYRIQSSSIPPDFSKAAMPDITEVTELDDKFYDELENENQDGSFETKRDVEDTYIQTKPMGLIPFTEPEDDEENNIEEVSENKNTGQLVVEPLPMGLIPAAFRITDVGDIKKGRTTLFETLTKQLFKIAEDSPIVLSIEDIQWASNASLDYLDYLFEQIYNKPILLIISICMEEINDLDEKSRKINDMLEKASDLENFHRIALQRLKLETVSKMIKKTFGREDVPDTFINKIYQKTEGNPLFIEDVIQALIEDDVIDVSNYVWQTRIDISQIKIPSTTREMLIARLGRLRKQTFKVLGYAAVIGREFSYDLLVELLDLPEENLLDAIDTLLDSKLIHEDLSSESEKFRFDNPVIQEIAYNELSRSRRRFLHSKIGQILEKKYKKDLDPVIFDLAEHYSKGRQTEKALKYLVMAGGRASEIYAIDDAQRYYLTALEFLNHFDYTIDIQRKEIELLNNLGNTCKMLGDWDQALEYYRNIPILIENLRQKIEDPEISKKQKLLIPKNWIQITLADSYWNLAELMRYKSDWDNAEENYKHSLMISQEIENYHGLAQAECGRGYIDWRRGDYTKALEHYDICVDFATKINDLPVIAVTYIDIGNIYNYTGEWENAIAHYKESIEHLDEIGWLHEMGRAYNGLGEVYAKQERWTEALENFEKGEEISKKIGDSYKRGWALFNAAECYVHINQFEKAMEYCNLAEEILMRLDDRVGLGLVYRNFGILYHKNGEWDKSEEYFKKSIKFLKQLNVPYEYGTVYLQYGLMLSSKGDIEESKKCLEFSLEIFKNMDAAVMIEKLEVIIKSKSFK